MQCAYSERNRGGIVENEWQSSKTQTNRSFFITDLADFLKRRKIVWLSSAR